MTLAVNNYDCIGQFDSAKALHKYLQNRQYPEAVEQILALKQEISDVDFPLDTSTYSRHILCKENGCWLLLIHWDKNVSTCIHGHPEKSFVYVIEGLLEVENFEINPLESTGKQALHPDQHIHYNGKADTLDNAVHQIRTKQQSISLHFYSDDPTVGEVFTDSD